MRTQYSDMSSAALAFLSDSSELYKTIRLFLVGEVGETSSIRPCR